MKKNEHPCTFEQFETLYLANLQGPDRPSAETAYRRTEAAMVHQFGNRKFSNYQSFRTMLSRSRSKNTPATADKKETLTAILTVVNTYVCTIDLAFLQRYYMEIAQRATQMEVFGPVNGKYDAEELTRLKRTRDGLEHLIKYIQLAIK